MRNRRDISAYLCALFVAMVAVMYMMPGRMFSRVHAEEDALAVLNDCIGYADGHDFSAALSGEITARVFGIKHRQVVEGERVKRGDTLVDRAESASALVKAAIKKRVGGGRYFVARGKFRRGRAEYEEESELSAEQYELEFGPPARGLLKYELGGAILSAQKLGEGIYRYSLDPVKATVYSSRGAATALGGSVPSYSEVSVTLYVANGVPVRTECVEVMHIDKFGGVDCTAVYTEGFAF